MYSDHEEEGLIYDPGINDRASQTRQISVVLLPPYLLPTLWLQ
jgi:hypothetical protein